jgi:ubiquinone/menaquinone biosynthesis C-methylase UbiE
MAAIDTFVQSMVISLIERGTIASVCDYGCGTGDLLEELDNEFPGRLHLAGVDYFSRFPHTGRPQARTNIALIDRGTSQYDELLERSRFDLVVSKFSLHHYQYPIAEIRNMATLLNPRGTMVLADLAFENLNDAQIVKNICSYAWENLDSLRGKYHRHHYTLEEALDIMSAIDVEVTESFNRNIPPDDADLEEETQSQLTHITGLLEVLPDFKNRIVRDYFSVLFPYLKTLVQEHNIDHSSIFVIVAQRHSSGAESGATPA